MIASLTGVVLYVDSDAVVIEAGGIGFRVLLPKRSLARVRPGQRSQCFTHLEVSVSSGDLTLVGFETREELETFRMLLAVSGIGPKAALALVDALSLDVLRSAIANEQPEVLMRVPGIGMKTARRIVFDLKDKLSRLGFEAVPATDEDLDLVEALTSLGYSVVEAQEAVQSVPREGSFEERLRQAIAYFAH